MLSVRKSPCDLHPAYAAAVSFLADSVHLPHSTSPYSALPPRKRVQTFCASINVYPPHGTRTCIKRPSKQGWILGRDTCVLSAGSGPICRKDRRVCRAKGKEKWQKWKKEREAGCCCEAVGNAKREMKVWDCVYAAPIGLAQTRKEIWGRLSVAFPVVQAPVLVPFYCSPHCATRAEDTCGTDREKGEIILSLPQRI